MKCYDAANVRPMNFHEECWNKWHCVGPYACAPCDPEEPSRPIRRRTERYKRLHSYNALVFGWSIARLRR